MHGLTTPHIAANIQSVVDKIIEEWDIGPNKVSEVITDNGSNMVAAFKAQFEEAEVEDD